MIKTDKVFLNLYLLAGMVHIYSVAARLQTAESVSKYLLMPMLAFYVIAKVRRNIGPYGFLLAAIAMSWFGDIFLLYVNRSENYFLFGLAAFLVAHIFYLLTFNRLKNSNEAIAPKYLFAMPVIYSILLLTWIFPDLGSMMVPVILYAIAITSMLIMAISRSGRTTSYSFSFVLFGAIMFVLSDSMIAVNKFTHPFAQASVLITVTYVVAQYLIVSGCLLHEEYEERSPELFDTLE